MISVEFFCRNSPTTTPWFNYTDVTCCKQFKEMQAMHVMNAHIILAYNYIITMNGIIIKLMAHPPGFITRVIQRVISRAENCYPSRVQHRLLLGQSLALCVMFCRSLYVILCFFGWLLYCLCFDLRLLVISFGCLESRKVKCLNNIAWGEGP